MVDRLMSVTAYSHGGGYRVDSSSENGLVELLIFMALILGPPIIGCTIAYLEFANAGRPHHGYWVVPRIWWAQPFLTTPCAGPEKKHHYRCGAHVAILVNGTYVRAVFSRVEEDIFPPRAEFSFVTDSRARTCEHQRLLEVETSLISRTCLLSAQDMYDGQLRPR